MKFSYNWLQSYFKQKLPKPEKLAELLTLHFAEVEEIKKAEGDFVLDIDVRPNRAGDCFSHLGIVREIAAILNYKLQITNYKLLEEKTIKAKDFVTVEVKEKAACPRYIARVITDVKVAPSPKWLQEKLQVCGLRPINNVVDVANYVMLETGQPLHVFDSEKLEGQKIIVRFAKEREKIVTLDEEKYDLDENILVIADEKKPVAIAGIKGGKLPEINEKTKIVVLESANFNPKIIRRSSQSIDLKTDASLRFEHGIDPNLTEIAINRAASLIRQLASGKIALGTVDFYPVKVLPKKIKLDLDYVRSLLGVKITDKEIKSILESLGFKITRVAPAQIQVEVPTRRMDVSLPEDLIEEIGRIYGYEKIPAVFPIASLIPPKRNDNIFWENFSKNILKEAGLIEVYNYSFVSGKDISIYQPNQHKSAVVELENPLSEEQKYLRPSLIPNLLKNVAKNKNNFKDIKIFELGKIFKKPKPKTQNPKLIEKRMLTGLMTGDRFFEAKGVVELLLNKLGVNPERRYEEFAEIKVKDELTMFDIDFEKLQKLCSEEIVYQPIPKFPSAARDLAILVPLEVKAGEVLHKIKTAAGEILWKADLFDIYEGQELPEGKKNLAFHLVYQSADRTLSAKEIDAIQNKIIVALEKNPEWRARK